MGWSTLVGLVFAAGVGQISEYSYDTNHDSDPLTLSEALAQQECMQECMKNFVAVSQRKELRPLYVVTTDVTLREAQENMEEVCEYVRKGLECMKTCDGGAMVVAIMERSGPTDVCMSKRTEFLQYAIPCEVENRDAIRQECGIEKLQRYVMILENLKQLLKVLAVSPEKAASTEFKEEFGEVCEYSAIIAECTTKVYQSRCTIQAQALTMGLLKKSLGATSPQQLGAIHWKCEQMALSLASIEKAWEENVPLNPVAQDEGNQNLQNDQSHSRDFQDNRVSGSGAEGRADVSAYKSGARSTGLLSLTTFLALLISLRT